jgi:hypothetical protein
MGRQVQQYACRGCSAGSAWAWLTLDATTAWRLHAVGRCPLGKLLDSSSPELLPNVCSSVRCWLCPCCPQPLLPTPFSFPMASTPGADTHLGSAARLQAGGC